MSKPSAIKNAKEDKKIISAIKLGDVNRFHEIEKRYHDKILFYLWHLVRSKDEAEDILQDVFMKTFKTLKTFDNRKRFSSWIYRIAHNEAINHIKHKSKYRAVSWEDVAGVKDRLTMSDREDSPQEHWMRSERRSEVRRALQSLPQKYREVLLLRFYFEKSYDEIADIIGSPRNTVGTLISRAKKRISKVLVE